MYNRKVRSGLLEQLFDVIATVLLYLQLRYFSKPGTLSCWLTQLCLVVWC